MLDTQGYSRRLLAISRDITDYRQVQESLRASEERLESVIHGSNDGFWDGHVLPGPALALADDAGLVVAARA